MGKKQASITSAEHLVLALLVALCSTAATFGQLCPSEPPESIRLTMPTRMINDKSLTLRADLLDRWGRIAWRQWDLFGTVSAVRVADQTSIPLSIVLFDTHDGVPPADSIHFFNGVGCVTITLDDGAAVPAGDIEVAVSVSGSAGGVPYSLLASKVVTVLDNPTMRTISGTLTGADLTWSASDGVIHLVDDAYVATGDTLAIEPGTLIMVEPGAPADGTLVYVQGAVQAVGTADDPIFFFPAAGPPAMHLMFRCTDPAYNPDAWRGVFHDGSGTSTYSYVILTGAGNGSIEGHIRPPVLRFTGAHSFTVSDSVLAYNNGKVMHGAGSGTYTVADSLISQCGHGGEWAGTGAYTLDVHDTWYTGIGFGARSCPSGGSAKDGDGMNIRASIPAFGAVNKSVTRCIFADGGDDGLDISYTSPVIADCIFWNLVDKGCSLEGTGQLPILTNLLMFDVKNAVDGHSNQTPPGSVYQATYCTFDAREHQLVRVVAGTQVNQCIAWPLLLDTCTGGGINYCYVGLESSMACGVGNVAADPLYVSRADYDYRLALDSPARWAGPAGEQVGWLGFPAPFIAGDHDDDGDLDLADHDSFSACMSGPAVAAATGCGCSDFDGNGTVDLLDWAALQEGFGSN